MHKSYVSLLSDLKKKIISKANLLPSWKFILFLLLSIQKQKIQISKNTWPMKSKSYLVGGESVPHNNFSILHQKIKKVCTLLKTHATNNKLALQSAGNETRGLWPVRSWRSSSCPCTSPCTELYSRAPSGSSGSSWQTGQAPPPSLPPDVLHKHTCILYIKHVPTLTLVAAARIKLQQAHLNGGILN